MNTGTVIPSRFGPRLLGREEFLCRPSGGQSTSEMILYHPAPKMQSFFEK
jgi:hypothetical protein